jgi:ABC-type branched-subunit amino acid transport system permease subunit
MCVFGGMRTFLGPIIGAAVFATLQYNLITTMPQIYMIIFGAISFGNPVYADRDCRCL